ncbi:MAG: hypothetical protein UMV23_00885 [Halanaerobium sp.]|nr:hypothetical protein [Halanaerobium sp.]
MKISIFHYLYLYVDDRKNIEKVYSFFGVPDDDYNDIYKEDRGPGNFGEESTVFPIHSFQKGEVSGCLHLYQDILVFSLNRDYSVEEVNSSSIITDQYLKWNSLRKKMDLNEGDLLGEATLLLAPPGLVNEKQLFKQSRELSFSNTTFKTRTRYGELYHFFDLEDKDHHIYALFPRKNLQPDIPTAIYPFLDEWLPFLDLILFKFEPKIKYYLEQTRSVLKRKDEIDEELSDILNNQLIDGEKLQERQINRTEVLDRAMERISDMYASLAACARTIKQAQAGMQNELKLFKDAIERISFTGTEENAFVTEYQRRYERKLLDFTTAHENVKGSLDNIKTVIEVIQAQTELARNRESVIIQKQIKNLLDQNVVLQEEGRTIEIAAGFIEFIIVMYYSLNIWKTLTSEYIFGSIPELVKFGVILFFAGDIVLATRLMVDFIQNGYRLKAWFIFSVSLLFLLVALMMLLSSQVIMIG